MLATLQSLSVKRSFTKDFPGMPKRTMKTGSPTAMCLRTLVQREMRHARAASGAGDRLFPVPLQRRDVRLLELHCGRFSSSTSCHSSMPADVPFRLGFAGDLLSERMMLVLQRSKRTSGKAGEGSTTTLTASISTWRS